MALTSFLNTFAGNPLDRASDRRTNAQWLAEQLASPDSLGFAMWNGRPFVEKAGDGGDLQIAYLPAKRLHLFALHVAPDAIDLARCRCRSFFPHHRTGRPTPEADAWAWKSIRDLAWCGKNMTRVLQAQDWAAILALPEVARIEVDVTSA